MIGFIRLFLMIAVLSWHLLYVAGPCLADDVPGPFIDAGSLHPTIINYRYIVSYGIGAFVATVVSEYLVMVSFLWSHKNIRGKLFFCVLLINLMTNPAAQFATLFLFSDGPTLFFGFSELMSLALAWPLVALIEIAVVAAEYGLMAWIFKWMWARGAVKKPISNYRTIAMVIVANLVSFALGPLTGWTFADASTGQ